MRTLLLDRTTWDLCKDAHGNIAVADAPYAMAQDAASAARAFRGEVWYDTTLGVPYFQQVLGKTPPLPLFKQLIVAEASRTPDVASVTCVAGGINGRQITGQLQVTDTTGSTTVVGF